MDHFGPRVWSVGGKGREGVEVGGTEAGCFLRESVEVDGGEWLRLRGAEGKQASVTSLHNKGCAAPGRCAMPRQRAMGA